MKTSSWSEAAVSRVACCRLWAPLLDIMLEPLGLEAGANKRQVAAKLFERASEEETEADTEMHKIVLADGTETLLRFQAKKVPWLGDIPGRVFSSLFQKEAKLSMCSVCRRAIIHIIYMLMCKAT